MAQHGRRTVEQWRGWIDAGLWAELAQAMVCAHYDPAYRRGGDALYRRAGAAQVLELSIWIRMRSSGRRALSCNLPEPAMRTSKLFNLPMVLTWARIAMIPFLVAVYYFPDSWIAPMHKVVLPA